MFESRSQGSGIIGLLVEGLQIAGMLRIGEMLFWSLCKRNI